MRSVLWTTLESWFDHGAPTRSAAIAFYSLASLAPVSVLLVWIGARVWESGPIRSWVVTRLTASVGPEATALIEAVMNDAALPGGQAVLPTVLAFLVFAFAATAVFGQLQGALRDVWGARDESRHRVVGFLRRRLVALSVLAVLGLVIIGSIAVSVAVAAIAQRLPAGVSASTLWAAEVSISALTLITLFTVVFRILPDADVPWREAAMAGAVTGVLHVAGQWVVGLYLGRVAVGSAYGAAAALVVFLTWVYYSSLVFLLGAELTRSLSPPRPQE